jgi:hypothetical protein
MNRMLVGAVVSAVAVFGLAQTAGAQVEISGRVYHVSVCPRGDNGPGAARCHAHVVTDRNGNPRSHAYSPNFVPSGFGPAALQSAYKLTPTGSTAWVAVVDAYGYNNAESDLNTYRTQYGLGACTTANGCFKKLNQSGQQGNYPMQNTGWAQETALDLQMVSAACPTCHIVLVEASSNSFSNLATAENTAAAQAGVIAISNSYGGGESGSAPYESAYNHPGQAVTVSSGDSGYGVEFPASSPHVTAVGGTSLYQGGGTRGWTESVWSGAGSGCSAVYAKPSWQHDPSCSRRTVADVSAIADPNTGVAVFGPVNRRNSGWLVFGGTSVAAPLIAGVYGLNGGTPAIVSGSNPYQNAPGSSVNLFDVTSGSNGSCGGSYLFTGVAGYDGPTGLGTPNGSGGF